MARKLRLEYPDASYHVINRGNYRAWIFKDSPTKAAFESCLFAACKRYNWHLHAFVIMDNHYHLALTTPLGNLVIGMQWLQGTFANRFNKLRKERGHLFQGRYLSLLVEDGDPLGRVCHYIHLNPIRAGLTTSGRLNEYRFSSFWYLRRPQTRPTFLRLETALTAAGNLPDNRSGWQAYGDYLAWEATEGPAGNNRTYVSLSRGWAVGTPDFKRTLLQDHATSTDTRAWEAQGVREVRAMHWQEALDRALEAVPARVRTDERKSAPWKVAVAAHLKETTGVSNSWLAQKLLMGTPFYVSKHVGLLRRAGGERVKVKGKA